MLTDEILEGSAESINQWQGVIEIYAEHANFDGPRVVIIFASAEDDTKNRRPLLITELFSSQMWFVFEQNVFRCTHYRLGDNFTLTLTISGENTCRGEATLG